jgi:Na+/pantothenate symporter
VAELSKPEKAGPVIQWTANLSTGAQETVALWPLIEDLYAVSVNGTAAFATDAAAVQRLMTLWDDLTALEQRR